MKSKNSSGRSLCQYVTYPLPFVINTSIRTWSVHHNSSSFLLFEAPKIAPFSDSEQNNEMRQVTFNLVQPSAENVTKIYKLIDALDVLPININTDKQPRQHEERSTDNEKNRYR